MRGGVVAAAEAAQADACQPLQGPAQPPVGEHPLDAIGGFAHVFEDQDGAVEIGPMGGAQQVGGHREIGHQQGAFGQSWTPALPG